MATKNTSKKGHGNNRTSIFDPEVPKPKPQRNSVLSSIRATQILAYRPALPAELISIVLDYLPPADLVRCAQVSRKLKEIAYDDSRWIRKLHAIGVWDDAEARQRQDEAVRKKFEAQTARSSAQAKRLGSRVNGSLDGRVEEGNTTSSMTLFDVDLEETKPEPRERANSQRKRPDLADGFDNLSFSNTSAATHGLDPKGSAAMTVLQKVRSVRGQARQQYGKIHIALNPLYVDITKPHDSIEPLAFRLYREPKQQAQVLCNLVKFGKIDWGFGGRARREKLDYLADSFQERTVYTFQQAFADRDVVQMRDAVAVLSILGGLQAAVDTFISNHPLVIGTQRLADPHDCVEGVAFGHVDLGPSQKFFQRLATTFADQASLIDQIFPRTVDVLKAFLDLIMCKTIQPFVDSIFGITHERGRGVYIRAVPGVFEQCMRFAVSLQPTKASAPTFREDAQKALLQCFETHVDTYLAGELDHFKFKADEEVASWEQTLSEQESRADAFYMSNISRQAAKRDFLSSFRKVIMMPVNAVAAFPLPGVSSNKNSTQLTPDVGKGSRPSTPSLTNSGLGGSPKLQPLGEAPTTELAAKAAIMNSRLEGIKTLFSIEVALSLVHAAKSTIERIAILVRYGDLFSAKAALQCEAVFIALLTILGQRHIKAGFDKAVNHLAAYSPQKVKELKGKQANADGGSGEQRSTGVEPLVTFLELVNVGDLIQQMVDVFYAQELVAAKLTDRDDFLNPASKEKKRFEQMLDERVAAGMSKGIDVLMDEIEYVCATTQTANDYNPGVAGPADGSVVNGGATAAVIDIGPSDTARQIVQLVEGHTSMLYGSTDKSMLDIFFQEVGLRLFGVLCKHIKRQRISVNGSLKLISDINLYASFAATLKQKPLAPYYAALRELSQIYLVDCSSAAAVMGNQTAASSSSRSKSAKSARNARAKELAVIIADNDRYKGVFGADEVLEFAERRADWYAVKGDVERALYGIGCSVM